eukprot:15471590-Alexandrium_andersonii.AAC.1
MHHAEPALSPARGAPDARKPRLLSLAVSGTLRSSSTSTAWYLSAAGRAGLVALRKPFGPRAAASPAWSANRLPQNTNYFSRFRMEHGDGRQRLVSNAPRYAIVRRRIAQRAVISRSTRLCAVARSSAQKYVAARRSSSK